VKSYYRERRCGTTERRDVAAGISHQVGVCVTNGTRITDATVEVYRDTNETRSISRADRYGIAIGSHYSHASNVVNHEFLDYRCRFKATVVLQLKTFRTARENILYFRNRENDEYMLSKIHLCVFAGKRHGELSSRRDRDGGT